MEKLNVTIVTEISYILCNLLFNLKKSILKGVFYLAGLSGSLSLRPNSFHILTKPQQLPLNRSNVHRELENIPVNDQIRI